MKNLSILCALTATAASSLAAEAPRGNVTEGALRQVQDSRQRQGLSQKLGTKYSEGQTAPELYPGESADVGPQMLVIPNAARTWFEVGLDTQYYYTSNIFLAEKGAVDTGVFLTTLQAAIAPTPFDLGGGQLSVRAGYRQQRYMYGLDNTRNQLNNFDFDSATVFLNGRYAFNSNWSVYAGADYNRLLSHDANWNEFYTEFTPSWALERQFTFAENSQLSIAYIGSYHFSHADPAPTTDVNDRLDSILSVSWTWMPRYNIALQPYYRFQQTHYVASGTRNDIFNTVGAAITWVITDWASVRTFANWESRNSNDTAVTDYRKLDAGGGLSLVVHF